MKRYYYITPDDYEIAKNNGLTVKNVQDRVYRLGWDIEKAINTPKKNRKEYIYLTVEEKEIIFKNNLTTRNVTERMYRGWTKEKAINTPKIDKVKNLKPIQKSNKYLEIAINNGIKKDTFYKRIKSGWSAEEACTLPPKSKKNDKTNHIWNKYEAMRIEEIKRNDRRNVLQ